MATTAQEIALMKQRMKSMEGKLDNLDKKLDILTKQLLNPDDGFVVRVNKNTERMNKRDVELPMWLGNLEEFKQMKRWKSNVTKALWGLYSAVIGYIIKLIFW